jgi:hypothetical protein
VDPVELVVRVGIDTSVLEHFDASLSGLQVWIELIVGIFVWMDIAWRQQSNYCVSGVLVREHTDWRFRRVWVHSDFHSISSSVPVCALRNSTVN